MNAPWQPYPDWHGYERCTECRQVRTLNHAQLCKSCDEALGPWTEITMEEWRSRYEAPELDRLTEVAAPPFRAMPDGPGSRPSGCAELHRHSASRFDPYRKGKAA